MDTINGKYFLRGNDLREDYEFDGNFIETGKNLYEVVRVIDGVILFLEDHLERLYTSAKKTELRPFVEQSEIKKLLRRMIKSNHMTTGNLKIIFHYGTAGEKTFMSYPIPFNYPSEVDYKNGVRTGIMKYTRTNPEVKIWVGEFKEKVMELREKNSWYEVLLENEKKIITEGSQSNLFLIKGKKLFTTPAEYVLHGITSTKVISLAEGQGIKVEQETFNMKVIKEADAVFLTGTSPKVLPVKMIGETEFSVNNKILKKLMKDYDNLIESYVNEHTEAV